MSLEHLKNRLPEYAKDLKLNLSSLATEPSLSEQQCAGTFIDTALASRNAEVTAAITAEFAPKLSPEALNAARAAASIMAMNNIYYRFTHLASSPDYRTLPAKLRMNADRMLAAAPTAQAKQWWDGYRQALHDMAVELSGES